MASLAETLSKATGIEAYEPTLRDNLRYKMLEDGVNPAVTDRLVGGNLPNTPLGGVLDFTGLGSIFGAQEAKQAYDQGRYLDAGIGAVGTALDAVPFVGALTKPLRRAVRPGNLPRFARNEEGSVPGGLRPDFGPETQLLVDLIDAGQSHKITSEMFRAAKDSGDDLSFLAGDEPEDAARLYHWTRPKVEDGVPGELPYSTFNMTTGTPYMDHPHDAIGTHTGTAAAAHDIFNQRTRHGVDRMTVIPQSELHGNPDYETNFPSLQDYELDYHPDAAEYVYVPSSGTMLELSGDTSRPFGPDAAQELFDDLGVEVPDGYELEIEDFVAEEPGTPWNENYFNAYLTELAEALEDTNAFTSRDDTLRYIRRHLAEKGYTNIPYVNSFEDIGSISQNMLTDRPEGSNAVLRERGALFSPHFRHLPDLDANLQEVPQAPPLQRAGTRSA